MSESALPKSYSVRVPSKKDSLDVAARFESQPVQGPMRTAFSEHLVRTLAELTARDPNTTVDVLEPITPIDPVSHQPDFTQNEYRVLFRTSVPTEEMYESLAENEATVYDQVLQTKPTIDHFAPIDISKIAPLGAERTN